ncbi:hypothetical protein [Flexivirga caeni]|uniref:Uncharacterized protein n=1 Tax=Flexivirga caeni TaxID=2294115 RepID=A0A3M9M8Q1_9MICO|nr:hypothetical protein [Flexivirga caeni]RNI21557.1 hypothetical protein EFY87_10325 [Flexivirga caeni]
MELCGERRSSASAQAFSCWVASASLVGAGDGAPGVGATSDAGEVCGAGLCGVLVAGRGAPVRVVRLVDEFVGGLTWVLRPVGARCRQGHRR